MKLGKLSVLLLVGSIALTGCVSVKPPASAPTTFNYLSLSQRQAQLIRVNSFIASGAFSIVEAGRRPVFANYQWAQNNPRSYRIRVSSALNLFNIVIVGRPHSVTLLKGAKQSISAPTPEALIKHEMGWTLPVRDLLYWIRGIAAPGQQQSTLDSYGHLATLMQDGWSIQFSDYTRVESYDLPQKIVLYRPQARLTIVIKNWELQS